MQHEERVGRGLVDDLLDARSSPGERWSPDAAEVDLGAGRQGGGGRRRPGIGWLGMISRMCRKAQRMLAGSCQLASVTRASSGAGSRSSVHGLRPYGLRPPRIHWWASRVEQSYGVVGRGGQRRATEADVVVGLVQRSAPCPSAPVTSTRSRVTRVDGRPARCATVLDDTFTDAFAVLQNGTLVGRVVRTRTAAQTGRTRSCRSPSRSSAASPAYCSTAASSRSAAGRRTMSPSWARLGLRRRDRARPARHAQRGPFPRGLHRPRGRHPAAWTSGCSATRGLYAFLATLEADRPHGGSFRYRSSETDALGWVCERASGTHERP